MKAVDGVSFEVEAGRLLALIGPNGAGKTTCFNMLNGQLAPDAGRVALGGRDITGLAPRDVWALGVGPHVPDHRDVRLHDRARERADGAAVASRPAWRLLGRARERTSWTRPTRLLEQVGMLAQAERACGVLAYGDLKRVELAVALANAPKLLLMDEPTAGMAPRERIALMELTARIAREQGIAVLFTEHDMDVVFAHADRIIVLDRGRLIADGKAEDVRANPAVQAVYLGSRLDVRGALMLTVDGSPRLLRPRAHPGRCGASRWRAGEVVVLLGRNGAGKSTTLKSIMGLVPPAAGRIAFRGHRDRRQAAVRDRAAGPRLRAGGPARVHRADGGGEPRGRPPARRARTRRRGRPTSCSRCSPTSRACATAPGSQMSGGEQQMLTIARTLMGNPSLVLLDEPSEGLAPVIVEQMAKTILDLKQRGPDRAAVRAEPAFRPRGGGPRANHREGPDPLCGDDGRADGKRGRAGAVFEFVMSSREEAGNAARLSQKSLLRAGTADRPGDRAGDEKIPGRDRRSNFLGHQLYASRGFGYQATGRQTPQRGVQGAFRNSYLRRHFSLRTSERASVLAHPFQN